MFSLGLTRIRSVRNPNGTGSPPRTECVAATLAIRPSPTVRPRSRLLPPRKAWRLIPAQARAQKSPFMFLFNLHFVFIFMMVLSFLHLPFCVSPLANDLFSNRLKKHFPG